ncbi:MAG TPA: ribosome small subunit-dependent GTPase A [Cyclobacteriaceae bacterium]|nr:ribosome small subunit-dependent GTPase A [Cyclobacteriaceae bacterium]
MKGLVIKSTGSWYSVLADDGRTYASRIRGKIRLEDIKETNPVAVGDYVELTPAEKDEAVITSILPRENYIARKAVKKSGQSHVIAANIDQALLVVSISFPRTSLGFIDRFTVSAEAFRIPQIIVFNKRDLLIDEEREFVEELMQLYKSLNINCVFISALHDDADEIKKLVQNKKTLITGHSGSGKSTLINKLSDNINQKTSEVSDFTSKGTHTTTFAEMFRVNEKTFVIDTPGIKEMGMVDMEPEEVSDYFVEMRDLRLQCKFGSRCLHVNEPKCAVKQAVENGELAITRYESYLSIIIGDDNRK